MEIGMRKGSAVILFIILAFAGITGAQDFWEPTNGPFGGTIFTLLSTNDGSLFAGSTDLFRSTDNGENWTRIYLGHNDVRSLVVNKKGDIFAGTFGAGVYKSTDNGENWEPMNAGLDVMEIHSLAVDSKDNLFAGTYFGGVFKSDNNGESWSYTGLTERVYSLAVNSSDYIFAGTHGGGLYRSSDGGSSWMSLFDMFPSPIIYSLIIDAEGNLLVGADGIYRSTDNGDTWTSLGLSEQNVSSILLNSNGDIFAGTTWGLYRSSDAGINWEKVDIGYSELNINCQTMNKSGQILCGTDFGIFLSTDNGNNWSENNKGINNLYIYSFAQGKDDKIFCGADIGLFFTSDEGISWYHHKSIKGAMRRANDLGARFCLIIGDNEIAKGAVTLKDMISSEQKEVKTEDIIKELKC